RRAKAHAQPQSNQLAQRVPRPAALPRTMSNIDLTDVACHAQDQAVEIQERPRAAANLLNDETAHYLETRQIEIAWLSQQKGGNAIIEPPPQDSPARMLARAMPAINNIQLPLFGELEHAKHVDRAMLAVIVHHGDVLAGCMLQSRQHGIVLAEVSGKLN